MCFENPVQTMVERPKSRSRSIGIREANGAEFLKSHPKACLRVGLQKLRQFGLPKTPPLFLLFLSVPICAIRGSFLGFKNQIPIFRRNS